MVKVAVTGANGFVGHILCKELIARGYSVRAVVRANIGRNYGGMETVRIPDITLVADWGEILRDVEIVFHLAARVHIMQDDADLPLEKFREANVVASECLARSAFAAGVKRFVYVSSIKVHGEQTNDGDRFRESDTPMPEDPYGISKWEAEQMLHRVAMETGLEIVIVRPPLVYGPNAKGNFAQMLKVLTTGVPLPLASVRNTRSLIYIGNLVDALIVCAHHPLAAGKTYLVSDGEDVSTPDLLRKLGTAMTRTVRLLPCPIILLKLAGRIVGKSEQIGRITNSLCIDGTKIYRDLNWSPPFSLQEGLNASCRQVIDK